MCVCVCVCVYVSKEIYIVYMGERMLYVLCILVCTWVCIEAEYEYSVCVCVCVCVYTFWDGWGLSHLWYMKQNYIKILSC